MKKGLLLAATLAATGGFQLPQIRERMPKNKYNLTEQEIEMLATMTPKEKKKFLRERK